MTKLTPQAKNETASSTLERDELSDEQLENVRGGAAFLSGSLTTHEDATPWLNTEGDSANGFIMRDTIILRTGR